MSMYEVDPNWLVNGDKCWGWAAYLLPYMEQQALYDMIDFTQYNFFKGDINRRVSGTVLSTFVCPSDPVGWVSVSSGVEAKCAGTCMDAVVDSVNAFHEPKPLSYMC